MTALLCGNLDLLDCWLVSLVIFLNYSPCYFSQWRQIDALLTKLSYLWQVTAFECERLPWENQLPALAQTLWQLDDEDLDRIDADQALLEHTLLPQLTQSLEHSVQDFQLPKLALMENRTPLLSPQCESRFSAHIKGRKWQQINAFVHQLNGVLKSDEPKLPILEWCAGKGHLGRLIAKSFSVPVVSLEWQKKLCVAGQGFADKWQLPQTFVCEDAFNLSSSPLKRQQHAVALHACGDLHIELLRHAVKAKTQAVSISPCCYHLIKDKQYQPLSELARSSRLTLSRQDLRLPLQQSVIASPAQQALRLKEVAWRLGFDSLQRELTGNQCYLPIPTIKQSQLSENFESFCRWAANVKSVTLPAQLDFEHYLEIGYQRQRLTRRIDLVAHLFRPLLERWLLLDRICFLQEQGYRVQLSQFCSQSITPRNAFIHGILDK